MNTRLIKTLKQIEELLQTASNLELGWKSKDECYQWIETTLGHYGLNGPAIKKICERAYQRGDNRYERLADISVSHLSILWTVFRYINPRGARPEGEGWN